MESNFQSDLIESEVLFKKQFDPNSIHFHNGDPTPVPVGGNRIPNSMPTVYQEEVVEKKFDYGPEYERIGETRKFLDNLKKVLAKLTPPMEAILRHKEVFAASASKENPVHIAKFQKSIEIEQDKIKTVLKELDSMQEKLSDYKKYKETLVKVTDGALNEFKDKEEYTAYAFEVKNLSKDLFKEMGVLLEKMKVIKKQVEAGTYVVKKEEGVFEEKKLNK